jgi:site-specific DNA recombinase
MKAAIYCRVSTDSQEREGTSLKTQLEACLKYCQEKGYDLIYRFSETYSGLTLERPKLDELRELVRTEAIDVIVCYCLDRLSRDPAHGVIVTQELEKHGINLETVTEDVDNSELGKLISYIRGFASKLEAEKIKERTMRGKRAKAKAGRITCGGSAKLYGYHYHKATPENGGRRTINEDEAKWVRLIYQWLVNDGMSTSAITYRLRDLSVPTKCGGLWCRAAVLNILKNPAYIGKTYAFTSVNGRPFSKNKDEWIEIPGATPCIISKELFDVSQKQLQINSQTSSRNVKRQYLLRGHISCKHCGRTFFSTFTYDRYGDKRIATRRYRCTGKLRMVQPVNRCDNRSWKADNLEALVWTQIEGVLDKPEGIVAEIERQRKDANQLSVLETELGQVVHQLKGIDNEQAKLLQWALKGFPEDQVMAENKKLNAARENLKVQKTEIETRIKFSQEAGISLPKLQDFVELVRKKLTTLDFETKRMAVEMLNIKVWIDGKNVEITGSIPMEEVTIVNTQS